MRPLENVNQLMGDGLYGQNGLGVVNLVEKVKSLEQEHVQILDLSSMEKTVLENQFKIGLVI